VDEVEITERRTAIGHGNNTIHTVEHVLAAVGSLAIDDIILELDGPEPPIMDGSFEPFVALLESAGILEHGGDPALFEVRAPFTVVEGDARYVVAPNPGQGLRCTTTIEWDHPLIGRQTGSWDLTPETFRREIAAARTFGFASEVDELQAQGLLQGASTENAVALSDTGVVGTELRWPDEFLRHKKGDILGDLALVGGRIQAHVIAHRPSHRGNVALARAILRMATSRGPVLDIERILEVIPHRYPMLLVDRIVEIEGPVHVDEVARRITRLWGLSRTGSRIVGAVSAAISRLIRDQTLRADEDFLSMPSQQVVPIRDRSSASVSTVRKPEMIPPAEIEASINRLVSDYFGIGREQTIKETAGLMGISKLRTPLRERIEYEIDRMISQGLVQQRDGNLYLVRADASAVS